MDLLIKKGWIWDRRKQFIVILEREDTKFVCNCWMKIRSFFNYLFLGVLLFTIFPFSLFLNFLFIFYFCKKDSSQNHILKNSFGEGWERFLLRKQMPGPSTQMVLVPKSLSWNTSCTGTVVQVALDLQLVHLRIICIYDDYGMKALWPIEHPSKVTWLHVKCLLIGCLYNGLQKSSHVTAIHDRFC